MTRTITTPSNRHLPTRLTVGLAVSVLLGLGTVAASAATVDESETVIETHSSASFGTVVAPAAVIAAPPVVIAAPPPVLVAPPAVVVETPVPVEPSRSGIGIDLPGVSIGIGR